MMIINFCLRQSKTGLNSELHAVDSGVLDSGFVSYVSGTWILDSLSRIPDSKAEGFRIPEMKFSGFWNRCYVTWCDVHCTGM